MTPRAHTPVCPPSSLLRCDIQACCHLPRDEQLWRLGHTPACPSSVPACWPLLLDTVPPPPSPLHLSWTVASRLVRTNAPSASICSACGTSRRARPAAPRHPPMRALWPRAPVGGWLRAGRSLRVRPYPPPPWRVQVGPADPALPPRENTAPRVAREFETHLKLRGCGAVSSKLHARSRELGFPTVLAWCPCPNISAHFLGLPCPGHQRPQLTASPQPPGWTSNTTVPCTPPSGGRLTAHEWRTTAGPLWPPWGQTPAPTPCRNLHVLPPRRGALGPPDPIPTPVPHSCLLHQKWGRHPGFRPSPHWRPRGPGHSTVAIMGPALAPSPWTPCQVRSPPAPTQPPDSPLHPEHTPSPVAAGAPALATPDSPTPRPRARPRRKPSICMMGSQSPLAP